MAIVSLLSNARAGASQTIDPIVASLAGMSRQVGVAQTTGGPYSANKQGMAYGSGSACTCASCPMHSGGYGRKSAADGESYGIGNRTSGASTAYGASSSAGYRPRAAPYQMATTASPSNNY